MLNGESRRRVFHEQQAARAKNVACKENTFFNSLMKLFTVAPRELILVISFFLKKKLAQICTLFVISFCFSYYFRSAYF